MLNRITITCFAASYLIVLALEVSRLFFRLPVRMAVIVVCTIAGLFAHTAYLWTLARAEMQASGLAPLSSWYDWCLLAAWILALAYLGLAIRRPQVSVGVFLLPLVLGLVGVAYLLRDTPTFPRDTALSAWRLVHAMALMLGTVGVLLGAATGVMYLIQSYRLKHKLLPRRGLRLPSLEWLQRFNKRSLAISASLMAVGLLSGIVLNLINRGQQTGTVEWTNLGVLSSGVLFMWLTVAVMLETFYRPARQGRKVALLTLASFVFLILALGFVLLGEHASRQPASGQPAAGQAASEQAASGQADRDRTDGDSIKATGHLPWAGRPPASERSGRS